MSETFEHMFSSWMKADARRWRNLDGSDGGIVAITANVDPSVRIPANCTVWPDAKISKNVLFIGDGASIGYRASLGSGVSIGFGVFIGDHVSIGNHASIGNHTSIGSGASIGDYVSLGSRVFISSGVIYKNSDWLFVMGPQGSRATLATAVYSEKHGMRWWVGCKHAITTDTLIALISETHGISDYAVDYFYFVECALNHPGLARAKAAIKDKADE